VYVRNDQDERKKQQQQQQQQQADETESDNVQRQPGFGLQYTSHAIGMHAATSTIPTASLDTPPAYIPVAARCLHALDHCDVMDDTLLENGKCTTRSSTAPILIFSRKAIPMRFENKQRRRRQQLVPVSLRTRP